MMGGAGFWLSTPSHRQELHLQERVKELEKHLGPSFTKHKEHVAKFFHIMDRNKDGELTPEEVEAHMDEPGPPKESSGFGKYFGYFVIFDFLLLVVGAAVAFMYRKLSTPVMHGKGKLDMTVHCLKNVALPTDKVAVPVSAPVKFQPVLTLEFNKAKAKFDQHQGSANHKPTDVVDVGFKLHSPLEVDFDYVDPKAKETDPPKVKFPKRWFTMEVKHKTQKGEETLGVCEVDIAQFVAKKFMEVHLGGEVEYGLCHKRKGKVGEMTMSCQYVPIVPPAAPPAARRVGR